MTVPATFGVVRPLAVKCLLGTPFTEKHRKKIHPIYRYVRPGQLRGVLLLSDEAINRHPG